MSKLSYKAKRVILTVIGVPFAISFVNYYASLNWFGGYDRQVMAALLFLSVMTIVFIGPTVSEVREERERRDKKRRESAQD